jgi:general secretion pathway protein D
VKHHRHGGIIPGVMFCLFLVGAMWCPGRLGGAQVVQASIAAAAREESLPATEGSDSQQKKTAQEPTNSPAPKAQEPVPSQGPAHFMGLESKPPSGSAGAPGQSPQKGPSALPAQAQPRGEQSASPPASAAGHAIGQQPGPSTAGGVSFNLVNADLLQFIGLVAAELKMNYVVDPAVKGAVTINTAGQLRHEDLLPILEAVLKINGATAVKTGNFYRIIPSTLAVKTPLEVYSGSKSGELPKDDRVVMQIIPLRYVFAADMAKVLTPFLTDSGVVAVHDAGNVLILADTSLNVKRLMDVIAQFDSAALARERVKLVPVENNVASGLVPELESIFSAYALADKASPIRFIPLDRINAILVVTPDPSAFEDVQKWIEKLDQPAPPSGIQTFVYHVQNSEADYLARLLMNMQGSREAGSTSRSGSTPGSTGNGAVMGGAAARQESNEFAGDSETAQLGHGGVRITTDAVNNSLIIQSTAQQYSEILNTLKQLDVVPREVMIEARVYEVTLTGNLSFGVEYYLQQRSSQVKQPLGSFSGANALQASAGLLIGQTRELMGFLNASENRSRVRVLSAPTVLATDNSDARIQVGSEIPILTSQGVVPVQSGGSSLFSNTIQNRDTGIILSVTPRITSTGMVSLKISQEISNAQPPAAGGIQSPSFLKRSIATRAVVADGETVSLGGLIQESVTTTTNRIPLLGDIPILGTVFGSTSYNRSRTELIVLLTPHIIKNAQEAVDATRELRDSLGDLRRSYKKEPFFRQ